MASSAERSGLDRLIDRPELRSALDQALDRRLTLIVAEAGAGKTTLLRQWCASHAERDFVFLHIDPADDDPDHFIRHFVAALAEVDPTVERTSQAVILDDDDRGAWWVAALAAVLEAMADIVIIVDDVQRFSNAHFVADLGELVERLPHNVHLVLSSRYDPPIALSRYRLEGELLEFGPAELAFNETESAELLRRIIGHPLRPLQVRELVDRTEGWAAGLRLAGLELKHEKDPDAFIAEFGGSDRLVADYLAEEVLAPLPAERRDLLLRMSTLDEMCSDLVEAATGSGEGQAILEQLDHESIFLVPLDTRRKWFRFHHLFRDLLRTRLRAEDPTQEARILVAAADWNFATGRAESAVEYLLEARAWDRAIEAIVSHAADVIAQGNMWNVVRWMLRIPEPIRSARTSQEVLAGALSAVDGRPIGPAAARGASRQHGSSRGEGGEIRTLAQAVESERAAIAMKIGDSEQVHEIVHAWDDLVPAPEPLPIVQRHILRAWLAACNDAPDEATRQLTEAVKVAEIHGLVEVFVRAGPTILEQLATISGPQAEFSKIIRARAEQSTAPRSGYDLPDPLTDRELEILEYFPTRFTNIELAERCFVSVNTIKTHMAHIYRKLDVTNRDTAINRARQFGLL